MSAPDQDRAVRELFSADAERYDARQYGARYRTMISDRQVLVSRVFRDVGLDPQSRILDVACGPGHFLVEAMALGMRPTGIDASGGMLNAARARLGDQARLVKGDAVVLPFASGSFDLVNCSGLIEYLPEPLPLLREILRVVRPGKLALIATTNRLSPALLLEPLIDAARRSSLTRTLVKALRLPFDEATLRERHFKLTFHSPRQFSSLLAEAGFESSELHYYHLQLLPHPIDRVVPALTSACVRLTDALLEGPPGSLAEGILGVARKPV